MTSDPNPSTLLRTLAAELRANRLDIWARDLEAVSVLVRRMEVTLDEITAEAQAEAAMAAEAADNAERAARLRGSNVVQLRTRFTGSEWTKKEFE